MTTRLELVPASVGKRLGAVVLDWLGPVVALTAALAIGVAGIRTSRSNGFIVYDTGLLVLLGSLAAGATLVYVVVLVALEARRGNTIGNQLMGIRSTDAEGYAPGGGAVFLRGLITGGGLVLAGLVSVLVLALGWFGIAVWVLAPLLVIAAAWAVVVVVSNAWDANGKLRGWHDKAAKSLMFDVKEGRNPVATGGIQGPYSFAPVDLPPVQQVASPVAGASTRAPHNPNQWQPPATPAPTQRPPSGMDASGLDASGLGASGLGASGTGVTQQVQHPDDDLDRTQLRSGTSTPPRAAVLRIRIDDGKDIQLDGSALLGRNPEGQAGELIGQLVPVADPGRSISKTHLHLKPENDGVWVTDRNSTNGSALTTPDGVQTRLHPGQPVFVRPGSTVHFGDRTFYVGQA